MSLLYDMQYGVQRGDDNFHTQLLRLMMKADSDNYARLKKAFPNTATVYEAWKKGEPIPDLPYEGDTLLYV